MKACRPLAALRLCTLLLIAATTLLPARATTVVPPDFPELVHESDYIVRAVVESTRAEYRDGPQGRLIVTFVKLRVREVLAGQPPAVLELEMLGGQIGEHRLTVSGAPQFRVGDEDFLFIRDNGRVFYPLYAMMHGRYPIQRDPASGREFVARSNAVPLQSVAEVSLPMSTGAGAQLQQRAIAPSSALTPGQFAREITTVRKSPHVRAAQK